MAGSGLDLRPVAAEHPGLSGICVSTDGHSIFTSKGPSIDALL